MREEKRMTELGRVSEITRYPVKSMAGIPATEAVLGWHGLEGDRRFGFRRVGDSSGFPFLTASRLPALVLYRPVAYDESTEGMLATGVRTPGGSVVALGSPELKSEISDRAGESVELMQLKHGIFDEGAVSVITPATIDGVGREAGFRLDRRRFRANIVVETGSGHPFLEDAWVGHELQFGESDSGAAALVTLRDERCVMVNIDPDTGEKDARVMKAVVRLNNNFAGVYATAIRRGSIRVGDPVFLNTRAPGLV